MNTDIILSEILKLSTAQKILLLEETWDSISKTGDDVPIPQWQQQLLEQRLHEHYSNPMKNNTSVSDFFSELRK